MTSRRFEVVVEVAVAQHHDAGTPVVSGEEPSEPARPAGSGSKATTSWPGWRVRAMAVAGSA
jgi:hypothetical protein